MYKLIADPFTGEKKNLVVLNDELYIPFDPANTDYQQFKQAINDDTAQLENADGVLMSQDDAKAYVATLP